MLLLLITWACQPDPEPQGQITVTVLDLQGDYLEEGELTVFRDSVFEGSYDIDLQHMGEPPAVYIPGKPGHYILKAEGKQGGARYKGTTSFHSSGQPMAVEVQLTEPVQ
jgi:hypothetical protein